MMILQTGFGTPDTQDFVRFTILADDRTGMYPTFRAPLQTVVDGIVGSDDFELQIMGRGPARVSLNLDFNTREDFYRFQAMEGTKHTLVLIAGFTAFEHKSKHRYDQDYQLFPDTILLSVEDRLKVGETMATATFIRSAQGMRVGT